MVIENDSRVFDIKCDDSVKFRLLKSKAKSEPGFLDLQFCCASNRRENKESDNGNKLIFHIHGGGYISMSSASHQIYTRKWANSLDVPVISIDYKLAPNNPYPDGLDDVWQAYNWILQNAEEKLGIKPEKIIIAGDSSGGNFALGLIYKAIMSNIKIPDGVILTYPSLRLDRSFYTPSLLLALDDMLIPHTVMKLILESYLQGDDLDPVRDPFISPITAPVEVLRSMPRVRMMTGDNDPLHDDC